MKNNMKKEFHYFVLTDYEIEEDYLRQMHKNGWKFVKVKVPGIYYFEACTSEDVVYRLDFNPGKKADKESYIQMFADYGWEYMQDMNEYSYFRKKADEYEPLQDEIFSDNESKYEMVKKIFNKRMLPILTIFALIILPTIFRFLVVWPANAFDWGLFVFYLILFAAYMYIIGRCVLGFYKLKKKYKEI